MKEKVVKIGNYMPSGHNASSIVDKDGLAPTVMENHGTITAIQVEDKDIELKRYENYVTWRNKKGEFNTECNRASLENDLALTLPTSDQTKVVTRQGGASKLRIRKLTPKECLRLMGFEDKDYQALKDIGMSDAAIYHMAGDSIITTCLMAIFSPLINGEKDHIQIINDYVEGVKEQ